MKNMEALIKEAAKRLIGKKPASPSEEDMASFASGLLDENEKDGILEYIAAEEQNDEALLTSFLIAQL